ncbi:hypothetical protein [Acinetobacter oleivorans]|uniref:hypothetical protein n=1 Tax=Acinetobacter oleivorans TaxID=1148157 RepID=UPI003A8496E8
MTRVSKRNFGESLSHAIEASDSKENNLKTIFGIINDVKADIEEFTNGKVSINSRDSQKHMMYKAAAYYSTFDKTNPILNKPTNQVLFLVSTIDDSKKQDLTVLELGSEGFPCTIYVEGNRMTAADAESFEENLNDLLSSPSTGEKLKSLITIEVNDIVEPELPLIEAHSTITPSNLKSG